MTTTQVIITVYHEDIDDSELLDSALYWAEKIQQSLEDDHNVEVNIPPEAVTVHTAPFKVE